MPRSSNNVFENSVRSADGKPSLFRTISLIVGVLFCILLLFVGGELVLRAIAVHNARVGVQHPALAGVSLKTSSLPVSANQIAKNIYYQLPHTRRRHVLEKSGLPIYDLRISTKNLHRLMETAEQVSIKGISDGIPREYMAAEFWMDGQWVPIQVKPRGLFAFHYSKILFSLRLKFPRERPLNGRRQINISHPYDKGLTIDTTTNWELQRYGILTWDDKFIVLRMNGKVLSVYQETEQFGRWMTDRSGRPEGYIFSGYGQLFGKEGLAYEKARAAIELVAAHDPAQSAADTIQCNWAFIEEYFDTDRLAWAGAMITLLGSNHAWHGDNLRLYWNPAYGQFEPIPWDYLCYPIVADEHPDGEVFHENLGSALFAVPEFRRERDRRLWTILTNRVEPMVEHANQVFDELAPILAADIRRPVFSKDVDAHQRYIATLRANRDLLTRLMEASDVRAVFWRGADDQLVLELENQGKAFVSAEAVLFSVDSGIQTQALPGTPIVDGIWEGEPGRKRFSLRIPAGGELAGLRLINGVTGRALDRDDYRLSAGSGSPPAADAPFEAETLNLAMDNVHVAGKTVVFGPGPVVLDSTLELPRGYNIVFKPGLELILGSNVSLLGYGDMDSSGTKEHPIRVRGSESAEPWGTVALQGTRTRPVLVLMQHTSFSGGLGGENNRTRFTGPLAVHGGTVLIRNCRFIGSGTEDGINLKNCRVQIHDNEFRGAASDAVDLDFCSGEVFGNLVADNGGDGLDVSGSQLTLRQNHITNCRDKGVSIGEESDTLVSDNFITHCVTGVAVKDRSKAIIRDNGMAHLEIGVALYVKKPSFGPSRAHVHQVAMYEVATPFLLDPSCELALDSSVRYHSSELEDGARAIPIPTHQVDAAPTVAQLKAMLTSDTSSSDGQGIRRIDGIPRF